ncbi:ankyrin and armadillo repeat-containing protein-like [Pelobates fuscus]|uniref:ankyrin and armadillo repeat-containing protein-like n=1 Tax=Pelobates fuscus TaxID=191477 RepID=UPI002FE4383C
MDTLSDHGWSPIHYAAYKNHVSQVERIVESTGPEILETLTEDSLQNTPLLLAALGGREQMVTLLVNLGADVTFVNQQENGVIEICARYGHLNLIKYFVNLDNPRLNVWKRLVAILESDVENDILCACDIIFKMTTRADDVLSYSMDHFVDGGLVLGLIGMLNKNLADDVKKSALNVLKSILSNNLAKRQLMENKGTEVLVSLLLKKSSNLLPVLMETVCELASEKDFTESYSVNILPALVKVISNITYENKDSVLLPAFKAIGLLARSSAVYQEAIGKQAGLISVLVQLYKECQSETLLVSWSAAVGAVAGENPPNQNAFINENIVFYLHEMLRSRYKDVKLSAVKTLSRLADGNGQAQKTIIESNVVTPIMQLLKRNQSQHTQEVIVETMWVLAGVDSETQRTIAARIGVSLLVEFLASPSSKLNLIGTRGLSVLLQGPYDLRGAVASSNGAHHLVQLLRSNREDVVLSAVQALRHICLGVGYIPHNKNQTMVAVSRGLKLLIALMTQSQSECIQVEAALAIAASVQGHPRNLNIVCKNAGFSYSPILQLLASPNEEVRLLAGEALATFAFNSSSQQKAITHCGGVQWCNFAPFLESANASYRAHAAFQLVVLAKIIPDKDPSYSSATGIQTLVGVLESSGSNNTIALAADCVARLSHSRTGVSEAMVSIDVVNLLCQLLSSASDQVQGSAAIALNFLSFNHVGERQLLKRLREDPHLMKALMYYNKKQKWPTHFLQRWTHIRELNLTLNRNRKKFLQSSAAYTMTKSKNRSGGQTAAFYT